MPEEDKETTNPPQLVNTVVTTMSILECFNVQECELTLNQLCQRTDQYKSRIHRLCKTLIFLGYLVKTSRTSYRLGPKLMMLGKVYEKTNSLKVTALPVMQKLSMKTELSSTLYIVDGNHCTCLAREVGPTRFAYVINEGDSEELYTTAAGRILLAYSAPEFTEKILLDAKPVRFTPYTITDLDKIRAELRFIKNNGYAVNKQERERGISAISAPIFNHAEKIVASLAVVGLTHRFDDDQIANLYSSLKEATEQISYLLGQT